MVEEHFDVVVVGSGFGASAAACRLAQAGRSVLILERGRSYPPGSFPRSPRGVAANLWAPSSGLYGMFDIWAFRGIESVVSSGLGGGSLIYANVMLRKDPAWFVEDAPDQPPRPWPVSYADLEPYYEAAEAMMGVQRYPFDAAPYSATPKTRAMHQAAQTLGLDWRLPPLAVSFASPGQPPVPGQPLTEEHQNLHGKPRVTCRLCGECDIGCNDGAKNTLDYTYLSRAADAGAMIRPLCEVRRIDRRDAAGGYRVGYTQRDAEHPDMARAVTVTGDRLVIGAGTYGSTFLLLRNRAAFPGLGPALGTRFSGNGDLLTFLRHSRRMARHELVARDLDPEFGPVITSAIRMPDTLDGDGPAGRGFYIEDGGNPSFLDWILQTADAPSMAARLGRFAVRRVWSHLKGNPRSSIGDDVSGLFGGGAASAATMPVLAMGRDIPNGTFSLRNGSLELDWSTSASSAYFDRVEATLRQLAEALEAGLANTPLWLFKRVITVHPLGGVPMGADPGTGVVDGWGESFAYPGLHVVDGSVMPGPVGANPSLTIAAFAERAAAHIIGE
ncbi:GMC family oxidoreductase [Trebonia kvetii]|uniref:Cholesterol oxidase n=1 Tax=Trebonia kvetii TaxID=2480626 RepID=A0A6P2BUX6_9ACTN|nr:GMC family oxidoreductase [Trebonia kvetii]